jgi:hypothetical protein
MGQPGPVKVTFEHSKDLGFGLKPTEGCGMDHPRTVAFVGTAWVTRPGFEILLSALLPDFRRSVDGHGYSSFILLTKMKARV